MKKVLLLLLLLIIKNNSFADEGMWLPIFLKQLNEADMKAKGMKISADDIYSVNKSSLKDAVVLFGGGCTGEIISDKGLLLTNHHCGFSQIQSHSSVEKDYLKNGFWAYSQQEELACPGLTVTFIIRIEDVTSAIVSNLNNSMSPEAREQKIREISAKLESESITGSHYTASVKPFYNGNQFYLFVMETFKDIRMVGAPPSSIGKFGGDTDNWMWPRHTGDFSLFRIYAGKDNKPAAYSADNIPFTPRSFFPVSIKGIEKGDFTMVYGFPGRTTQYLPSYAVKTIIEVTDPVRIKIRDKRLDIIDAAMRSGAKLRIQYASKQATIANAWKKWQGELKGLKRLNTVAVKQEEEKAFQNWVTTNNKAEYSTLLYDYNKIFVAYAPLARTSDYINEAAYGVEILKYARGFSKLVLLSQAASPDETAIKEEAGKILAGMPGFFRDYDLDTDKKLFSAMMEMYLNDVDNSMHPAGVSTAAAKFKNDFNKMADSYYSKSVLSDSTRLRNLLQYFSSAKAKQLLKDPLYSLASGFNNIYTSKIEKELVLINNQLAGLNRKYMAAQMEMQKDKLFYPDANSTLRVAYGNVGGYEPRDAVRYEYISTVKGIIEKEDSTVEEFQVPDKLKELYKNKDFGDYSWNGEMPVAFVASNHTTGGNSGSPVINANGELIGTNFDRVWEGTMSDIEFDPDQCRNIALDIRYTLFIIDKFAGCKRLIDEMKIIRK
jgi:hypothetical protein